MAVMYVGLQNFQQSFAHEYLDYWLVSSAFLTSIRVGNENSARGHMQKSRVACVEPI
jgi:hypothetical protein